MSHSFSSTKTGTALDRRYTISIQVSVLMSFEIRAHVIRKTRNQNTLPCNLRHSVHSTTPKNETELQILAMELTARICC